MKVFQNKENNINLIEIKSLEELVTFYIEQFVSTNDQMANFSDKMKDIMETFADKGIDFDSLFSIFKKDQDKKDENKEEKKKDSSTNTSQAKKS